MTGYCLACNGARRKLPLGEQASRRLAKVATRDLLALFHPDYTVGPGFAPGLLTMENRGSSRARGLRGNPVTAGGEFHPALRTLVR